MAGDFNALSYDNINISSIIKISTFHLKEQILDCFGFVDFALKNDFVTIHIMTNNINFLRA